MIKLLLIFTSFFFAGAVSIAQQGNWYAAAKAGLSIREKPSATAKILDKVPYGDKVTAILIDTFPSSKISTEGFNGHWQKIKYKDKEGYVVDSYLLPEPAPKATAKTLKDYLSQLSSEAGAPVEMKKIYSEEMSSTLKKQLFKNGMEVHEFTGYEYNSETIFLPDFTLEQGYLLLRLLKVFPLVIGDNDPFPAKNSKKAIQNGERTITVEKKNYGSAEPVTEKITYEWEDGANYELQLYMLDNQLVIFSSGGV